MTIAAIDVHYKNAYAVTAAITFEAWKDSVPSMSFQGITSVSHAYVSGKFFLRELPCIKSILKIIKDDLSVIIIDGYVRLSRNKPGLGFYLFEELGLKIPIIGVAKNPFKNSKNAIPIFRGKSKKPLFITSAGIPINEAAKLIREMHGSFRTPTLLKKVDNLTREKHSAT